MTSKLRVRRIVVGGLALACALTACSSGADSAAPQPLSDTARVEVRRALDAAVAAGTPGVQVVVTEHGQTWTATAGVGNIDTKAPFPDNAEVRVGSNTKAFVATVMMQLAGEGKVDLDAPIERYLPGVVQGEGIDGNRITVRNLMQHTSGLPEYLELPQLDADYETMRTYHFESADLVRAAVASGPAHFPPGEKAEYSNTNYLIVGMLVERLTGHPFADEVDRRVIQPLGLKSTYIPAAGEIDIRNPHPLGYEVVDGKPMDFTQFDTSWAGSAGALISTGADLDRFFTALLFEKLLQPAQLAEMRRDPKPLTNRNGIDYALGLARLSVPCGKEVWGHGGSIPGFRTHDGVTVEGRAVTVLANLRPVDPAATEAVQHVFDTAICQ
ncbi:beta-lactamase family protein [Nocardia sp. NBC_01503]|uniref:serine hydrolase domain-containing protein n=1 Tax=Nocardia sp. NBC_01503 TaxID=2975997 RepID=UPI002E7BAEBB|nr:serine hydrolase domain-containing protein [Nocardia sp. NBC_01503]WTL32168.1 beta-lactamase family protein [Nocardia sp. NBC_01503]